MPPPAKRRKTESKVENIEFNLSDRYEYLTGFHKRNVQRAKQAQEAAKRRAREERIAERKRIREERKADLERHVREVNALIRPESAEDNNEDASGDETGESENEGWEGIEDASPPPVDHEAEYIDEDKNTIVTVTEIDPSRDGLSKLVDDSDDMADKNDAGRGSEMKMGEKKPDKKLSAATKEKRLQSKLNKRKRKNFRYESKVERKVSRVKAKAKSSKQARARKAG